MAEQELTTSELGRWMQRLEKRVDDGLRDITAELRKLSNELRDQSTERALMQHRLDQVERHNGQQDETIENVEKRVRAVEDDLNARKHAIEKSKRTATWISLAFGAASISITIIDHLVR